MHNEWLGRLLGCAMLAAAPLMVPTLSDAQAPPGPPPPAPIMPHPPDRRSAAVQDGAIAVGDRLGRVHVFEAREFLRVRD
jgi:hypothetical protein